VVGEDKAKAGRGVRVLVTREGLAEKMRRITSIELI